MKKLILAALSASSLAVAAPHTHDGFFLNLAFGPGLLNYSYTDRTSLLGEKLELGIDYSGMAYQLDIKLGGRISDNLLLHATMSSELSTEGVDAELTIGDECMTKDSDVLGGIRFTGVGVTYYLPINVFFTGSLGMGRLILNSPEEDFARGTEQGFAFQVGVGKEWWVSDNWGLGASVEFTHTAGENGAYGEGSANAVHVLFSATFN